LIATLCIVASAGHEGIKAGRYGESCDTEPGNRRRIPRPAEVTLPREAVLADFAEQLSVDVSMIGDEQRSGLRSVFGDSAFGAVVQMYIADFVPRVRAGLEALGVGQEYLDWADGEVVWDHTTDPSDAVFNGFLPAVARLRELDAL